MSWLDTGAPNAGHSVDCPVFHSSFPCVWLFLSLTSLLSSSPVPSLVLFPSHLLTSSGTLRWKRDCRLSVVGFTGHVRYPLVCLQYLCHCWKEMSQVWSPVLSLDLAGKCCIAQCKSREGRMNSGVKMEEEKFSCSSEAWSGVTYKIRRQDFWMQQGLS